MPSSLSISDTEFPATDDRLSRKIRQRRCIATAEVGAMEGMLRFVIAPDGTLTPDISGKLPGRGAHLIPTLENLEQAIKSRAFTRAFKRQVTVPSDFAEHLSTLVLAALHGRLAMARRAGDLALGQDAVFAAAQKGTLSLLILPHDATPNASARLSGIARDFPTLTFSTADALGQVLGRPRISNLAFTHAHKGEQFLAQAHKFRDFLALKGQEPQPVE